MRAWTCLVMPLLLLGSARAEPDATTLPAPSGVIYAEARHRLRAAVCTNQRGPREIVIYANLPQDLRFEWHVNAGGRAEVATRPAWDAGAEWTPIATMHGGGDERDGARTLHLTDPTAVRLRVRGPAWPRSGIARLRVTYDRSTVAVLRGAAHTPRRPVVVLEGMDLLDNLEANDPVWEPSGKLVDLVREARDEHGLDVWFLDWGAAGEPVETLAGELTEVLRGVRAWNGGARETTVLGVSMGAVIAREATVSALERGEDLGVRKLVSLNGPHRGAWLNPHLAAFLRKYGPGSDQAAALGDPQFVAPLDRPSTRQLLIGSPDCEAYLARLRGRGRGGYDPAIEIVAFSNGAVGNRGDGTPLIRERGGGVIQSTSLRPLWLPLSLPVSKIRGRFQYDGYPGDTLLSDAFDASARLHFRVLTVGRMDVHARFRNSPTFIPTHSAFDAPEDLERTAEGTRYGRLTETPFARTYAAGLARPHLNFDADWQETRGASAVTGRTALLTELGGGGAAAR